MLLGRSFVDFDREFRSKGFPCFKTTPFSLSNVVALGGSAGAMEKSAALNVATRIGFSGF